MEKTIKHIHFIGICGVAMSALAIAFHKRGYKVTGSDKGFYPPVSTYLKEAGIAYYPGWHPEKMTADGNPDLVVVGNVAGSKNPEWLYVQEHHLDYVSYPEVLEKFFIKDTSIVCAGTYGKTTSTSLLSWMFLEAGNDPSYMFGGISRNDIPAASLSDGSMSIMEGDEYKSARWDNGAKFFHYHPTHLLLTSVVWDHADVYPTAHDYDDAFIKLVTDVPADGLIVLSAKVVHEKPAIQQAAACRIVSYGKTADNDYQYKDVTTREDGVRFTIVHNETEYHIHTPELGDYMADNMTGCFAMAAELGMRPEDIVHGLTTYKNIKRRLERRNKGSVHIFDDIAHSPKKAEAVLRSLQKTFSGKLIAVFEPNSGNRQEEAIPGYAHAFVDADTVIIPRLSRIKRDLNKRPPLDGEGLAAVIGESHEDVRHIDDDAALINTLAELTHPGDVVVFLGSHGFRGMINEATTILK